MIHAYSEAEKIKSLVDAANKILIIQADNPDADSLGSALALEHILGDMGKITDLYCGVEIPTYLKYLPGWDRVSNEVPKNIDLSIIVDASTITLFEKLTNSGKQSWLATKPVIVLDHHESVDNLIPFATFILNDHTRASTGELIYLICKQSKWEMSIKAQGLIMMSILGDTQGLSNQLASPMTYRIMAAMLENGVDRQTFEEDRKEYSKMEPVIYKYKAELILRTVITNNSKVAYVTIPQTEINQYSPLYNPAPLVQNDMLQTKGVLVSIVFKYYDDGKITAAIRCNPRASIAADLAKQFGGGGHAYAAGFKTTSYDTIELLTKDCIAKAENLIDELDI